LSYNIELGIIIATTTEKKDLFDKSFKLFCQKERFKNETLYLNDLFKYSKEIIENDVFYFYIHEDIKYFHKYEECMMNLCEFCTQNEFAFSHMHIGDHFNEEFQNTNITALYEKNKDNQIFNKSQISLKMNFVKQIQFNFNGGQNVS